MYRRSGSGRQGRATRPSAFLRIELAEPTHGPLALAHLSHFELGLFVPERAGRML